MPRAPQTPAEYWDPYKPHRGDGPQPRPDTGRFAWTQYPGHGPGAELLGSPRRALDLGSAEGKEAAHLAERGVRVTGVDLSAVQVARARAWWHDMANLDFVHSDHLKRAAFARVDARVLAAPSGERLGTLLVVAHC
ncbi:hypothetical protein DMH18_30185 [Streptomyces sp. WAC 06783]|uniref:class I SAM-dependent methyltransferase n=1 Tax=Streptomyces sp. WAC 06783 TaxID=2203211 RepID=UPI000F73D2E9|nr:class I SAM-dependent methyltransferase [Streptomyces sp. WAC 06783]RSO05559.1 hypothetical protein DMH18_30185 [Streptomyces sp. WAC 06783]